MSTESNGDGEGAYPEPDFAQAFKDLAKGERAATALENHLDTLEKKIEELLAKADEDERKMKAKSTPAAKTTLSDEDKGSS